MSLLQLLLIAFIFIGALSLPFVVVFLLEMLEIYNCMKLYPIKLSEFESLIKNNPEKCMFVESGSLVFGSSDGNTGFSLAGKKMFFKNTNYKDNAFLMIDKKTQYFYMNETHKENLLALAKKEMARDFGNKLQLELLNESITESKKQLNSLTSQPERNTGVNIVMKK